MIEIDDIRIDDKAWAFRARLYDGVSERLLTATINSLAREVEEKAREFAPIGEPPPLGSSLAPGTLKREGIIRTEASSFTFGGRGDEGRRGEVVTNVPAIGGGLSVRGGNPANRGQFSAATRIREAGYEFKGFDHMRQTSIEAHVTLNPEVKHAMWVHEGTGIYGPKGMPIRPRVAPYLVFHWHGRIWEKKSVRGQRPQPFLTEAFEFVNHVYTPAKVSELRAKLAAEM